MVDKQKAYQEELAAQWEQWNAQVALYRAKAEGATAEARDEFFEITGALQRMQDEIRMKLHQLQVANDRGEDLPPDVKNARVANKILLRGAASKVQMARLGNKITTH